MVCILFINFFFSPIFDNFPPYFIATDITGSNYFFHETMAPEMWSSFFSVAVGLGSLIMGIVLSMMKQREKCNRVVRWGVMSVSFLTILMAVFYGLFSKGFISINALLVIILVILFLIGAAIIVINVPSAAAMMKLVDKDKFGKVSSVTNIGSQGLIPLSMFLGGIALTYLNSLGLLIVCASGLLVTSLILFFAPSVREI